jgi:hypothetical protein
MAPGDVCRVKGPVMTLLKSAAVFCLLLTSAAQAADDGASDANSSGSVTITASITSRVNLTRLSDVRFDDAELGAAMASGNAAVKAQSLCVWSNNSDRSYFVTASSSGGSFALVNGDNAALSYGVRWNERPGRANGSPLLEGLKSPQFRSSADKPDCGGGTSASLIVRINGANADGMRADTVYAGTLTLIVSPN